ncbi:conserved hypothetical protein (putative transposase or invertase) [Desulfonispora thiosulfatigenes DSM 11270]|uniref:PD-(D/E)XK nuclease family transposase n=1 Tax=Desulfonispora thiosulfatigenes DSM 11270 TaxID=656914 RepID=A0A1W1V5H7_DESTI|nr:Rpn family recombination-promoting nuclease/putative transposase [Desulfonispora thiosulfatigenes]SMB88566.1 conserved hypothetical protein (putative transposase or invertase) [Desulfonispora thiosulfatigenes DSM 11270]
MKKNKKYDLMDPKIDFAFKQIFAGKFKESKIVLIDLLNSILGFEETVKITDILYLNPYTDKEYEESKQSILDIKVKTNKEELIDIEIQIRNSDNYRKRSLYYWSTIYGEQIVEGEAYNELKRCIVINILNFNLITENEHYHSIFNVREKNKNFALNHDLEIHYLELKKFLKSTGEEKFTGLEQWLIFLKDSGNENKREIINQIRKENEVIDMAGEILEKLSQDEKARAIYQQRRKWYLDKVSSEKYFLSKGREEGIKEGIKEGELKGKRDIAKKLISLGIEIDKIEEATKLSRAEIEEIAKE